MNAKAILTMEKLQKTLDMKSISDMLLATREDLEKCKTKDHDLSDHTINSTYAQAALVKGIEPINAYQQLIMEANNVIHFNTGNEE